MKIEGKTFIVTGGASGITHLISKRIKFRKRSGEIEKHRREKK
jgi:short-subunit dehydrogenase involved in D-alanine esterification of teichoic acids